MAAKFKRSKRTTSEVLKSMQKTFIETNGFLLTEEEAIRVVDMIREERVKKGELGCENKNLCHS